MLRILFLMLLILPATGMAQQRVPDNEEILAEIIDGESPHYYPHLMERYMAGDTTLTLDDYYYLYYGFVYDDNYRPLEPDPGEHDVLAILATTEYPDSLQLVQIVEAGNRIMVRDPFSPSNLNFLTFAYGKLGDRVNERINYDRMNKVMATIAASGSGTKESSPWHVLTFQHAADFTAWRGGEIIRRQVRSRSVEYVQLRVKDEDGNKGYFFDFSRVYMKRPEQEKPKKSPGWKINDIPVK